MPEARHDYNAVELNGKIYIADYSYFFCYDTFNDSWSNKARAPTAGEPWLAKSNGPLYAFESNRTIVEIRILKKILSSDWVVRKIWNDSWDSQPLQPNLHIF